MSTEFIEHLSLLYKLKISELRADNDAKARLLWNLINRSEWGNAAFPKEVANLRASGHLTQPTKSAEGGAR